MDTIRLPKSAIFLGLLLTFFGLRRTEAQVTTTSNAFVAADIHDASGGIDIYLAGTNPKEYLTNPDHSYLTVQVGTDYYTNNNTGYSDSLVEPSGVLASPINISTIGKTKLVGDTVQTIWQPKGPNAFDIVQDVYPMAGVSSGQIVYKWSIVNREATGLTAQVQFLLDLETDHDGSPTPPSYGTDIPAVTTRDGYNADLWQDISNVPYFLTSEYRACDKNFPGILGAGFMVDDFAPVAMNLMQPSEVVIVDWQAIATQYLWGYPANMLGNVMNDADNALLLQWPSTGVFGGASQEIGRGSYGTPPCTPITYGNLDALLLHPDHIKWNGSMYVPNRFPVEAIMWNSNNNANASGAIATQTIANSMTGQHSGPVQVISPAPIAGGGYVQSHLVQSGGSSKADSLVPECGMGFVTWEDTVLANILINCTTDSIYEITLSVSAANVQQPIFPFGLPVCPIIVDCQEKDTASTIPILTVLSRTGSFDGSICNARAIHGQATDPRMCMSCFVKSVSATQLQNMTFAIEDSTSWKYVVSVIDSMQNGSATVYALDNTGEWDTAQYSYCTIPDTHAPRIERVDCSGDTCICYHNIFIHEDRPWDRGLDTVIVKSMAGVIIRDSTGSVRGKTSGAMCIADNFQPGATLCVEAIDLAGNKTDTCFSFAPSGVASSAPEQMMLLVSPNPASGSATISLTGAPSANVEIFDVLGREVASFRIAGSYEWQMGTLSPGTYIVRAESDGTIVSRRVMKQ